MKKEIGLYIGRFQPFHNGHKSIVDTMLKENNENIILIGVSEPDSITEDNKKSKNNPFSFYTRLCFFGDVYKKTKNSGLMIYPLLDTISDSQWIQSILDIPPIADADTLHIYCGDRKNDSAIQVIQKYQDMFSPKKIEIQEIPRTLIPISGTEIRNCLQGGYRPEVGKKVPQKVLSRIMKK